MRFALAAAVLALSLVPSAGAAFGPPLVGIASTLRTLPVVQLRAAEERAPASCSAHARRNARAVSRAERKLAPVACEQPPRSKVLGTGFGFFFRLSP